MSTDYEFKIICPKCGSELPASSHFCNHCGHQINNAPLEHKVNEGNSNYSENTDFKISTPKATKKKMRWPLVIGIAVVTSVIIAGAVTFYLNGTLHGCTYNSWQVIKEPTCVSNGLEMGTCLCGDTSNRIITAKGHTEVVDAAVSPTCTSTGLTEGKHCSACNETITPQNVVEKIPHAYSSDSDIDCNVCGSIRDTSCTHPEKETIYGKSASCTATGLTNGEKCKKCGEVLVVQNTIPIINHTETIIPAVNATCTKTGLTAGKKCSVCGTTLIAQQETPKVAHTYEDKYDERCNVCGFKRTMEGTEGLEYYLLLDDTYGVKVGTATYLEEIIIPSMHNGKMVTAVLENAFEGCKNLKTIKLPSSLISINGNAFNNCINLESVTIPQSVTYIGNSAFSHCARLTNIFIVEGSKLETIGNSAFYFCSSLEKITLEKAKFLKSIESATFYECSSLSTIIIPPAAKSIGYSAFYSCARLTNVQIPASIEIIGSNAFYLCRSLKNILFDGDSQLNRICSNAFHGCDVLESIIIPQTVRNIEYEAFVCCYNLARINFEGTIERWNTIVKGYNWDRSIDCYFIYCTDGQIAKDGTVTYS